MSENEYSTGGSNSATVNSDDALPVFPFYLLVDVSGSMSGDIRKLNEMLAEFRDKLRADPITEDCILFSVLSFGSSARIEVPLGNFGAATFGPDLLKINGSTRYSEAFRTLKSTIERDLASLRQADRQSGGEHFRYYRPAAFFLTDGEPDPGDPWQQAFAELTSIKAHPLFVPFGFRAANDKVLRQLVHPIDRSKLYFTHSTNVATILKEMLDVMFVSILSSAQSVTTRPAHILMDKKDVGPDIEVQQYEDGDWV